jgi:phosphoribosyl-dephospho-CoA transferase
MEVLARNQLVWIDSVTWAHVEARVWDTQAQDILAHWRANRLPLVVCRQRTEIPPDQLCLGLPAPLQWSRRRVALSVSLDHLTARADFPTLMQVAQFNQWGVEAHDLCDSLDSMDVSAHVYGSHGWQWLTNLDYLHDASDLDLSLNVNSFEVASQVVQRLARTTLRCRIDGEIVFPQGQAIAWRELHQLLKGQTSQVLVKDRQSIRLADLAEVRHLGKVTPATKPVPGLCFQ